MIGQIVIVWLMKSFDVAGPMNKNWALLVGVTVKENRIHFFNLILPLRWIINSLGRNKNKDEI